MFVPISILFDPSRQKAKEDHVVQEDIYKVLLHKVLKKLDGITPSEVVSYIKTAGGIDKVLTRDLFNKSYGDVSHLTLCENKQQHIDGVPATTNGHISCGNHLLNGRCGGYS